MIYDAQELAQVRKPVLLVAAAAWALILLEPAATRMAVHCPAPLPGTGSPSFRMLLAMNPPATLAAGWALMLVAMMLPTLIPPLRYIRMRSFTRRCKRAIVLFLAGYGAIWMLVGLGLLAASLLLKLLFLGESFLLVAGIALVSLLWQFSPIKQRCLNRCHAHPTLAAFGARADRDVLRFGIIHGAWCAGSCWALMLIPMFLPQGHIAAMAIVTFLIFSERLESPSPPCWSLRGLGKVGRILMAQSSLMFRTRSSPMHSAGDLLTQR